MGSAKLYKESLMMADADLIRGLAALQSAAAFVESTMLAIQEIEPQENIQFPYLADILQSADLVNNVLPQIEGDIKAFAELAEKQKEERTAEATGAEPAQAAAGGNSPAVVPAKSMEQLVKTF